MSKKKQKSQKFMIRQGDVLVMSAEAPNKAAALTPIADEGGRTILAHGEVTGHAHALSATEARLFSVPGSTNPYLDVGLDGALLRHEEHTQIPIAKGIHRVIRQKEYRYGESRRVED